MFSRFEAIARKVTNLTDSIRTVTRSSDPKVMDARVSRVPGRIGRVESGGESEIFIQSPTLDILFAHGAAMSSKVELTADGIVGVQASAGPDIVEALHVHAA
jgi:hypothetical protein